MLFSYRCPQLFHRPIDRVLHIAPVAVFFARCEVGPRRNLARLRSATMMGDSICHERRKNIKGT